MKLGQVLTNIARLFKQSKIKDPADEATCLLCHLLKCDKAKLYSQPEQRFTRDELIELEAMVRRRLQGEPAAYIVNQKEFYGISLYVDPRVLIPRPETEILVEETIKLAQQQLRVMTDLSEKISIADVGTGSGAIAIAIAKGLPQPIIYGIDVSAEAMKVAALNIERHNLNERIVLMHGNLLTPVTAPLDIVVANLPYIKTAEIPSLSHESSMYEPHIALDGGLQGISVIGELLRQAKQKIKPGGAILLEIGQGQGRSVLPLIKDIFPQAIVTIIEDLGGIDRVIKANL